VSLPAAEEKRNLLLRRVDWRFLLPDARVQTSICINTDDRLAEAVGQISDTIIDQAHVGAGADLAVLVNPDARALHAARAALRPGGACYAEWISARAGGSYGIRRNLSDAGFTDVACYWAWPPPGRSSPRFWVPLQATGVQAHFLTSRPVRPGLIGTLRRLGLSTGWRLALRAGAIAPVCAVFRKPPIEEALGSAPGIDLGIARVVRDGWSAWGLGPRPHTLAWLLLTGGDASFNKVVGLVCSEPEPRARVAVKLSRSPTSVAGLQQESRALEFIAAARPHLRGVPRRLFCEPHPAGIALGQTVVDGRPLIDWLRRDTLYEVANAVTEWFAELAGRPEKRPRGEWWPRLVVPTLDGFSGLNSPSVNPDLVARTRSLFGRLEALPLTISHGDAGPMNVLMDERRHISVIDWEDCEPLGLPVGDLVVLLTFLFFHLDNPWRTGRFREVYRSSLDPSTYYGRIRADCLARYSARVGIDPTAITALAVVPWMQRSLREHQGVVDATLGSEGLESFARGLYACLWDEELRAGTGR
jgi:hypothetical protein